MKTSSESAARGFYIGLAIGQIWLVVISTSFVSVLWVLGQNPVQVSLILAGVVLVGLLLLGAAITLLRDGWRLPREASPESVMRSRSRGRKIGWLFGLVVLAEVVIIGAIDAALGQTNHGDWIVPVTYFIVGLHFIPLAFVFRVRPYVALGVLWAVINLATVIFTSANLVMGQAWVLFPLAGCGLATWLVVAYILWENIRKVHHIIHLPSPAESV
jgi:hypothetical protein